MNNSALDSLLVVLEAAPSVQCLRFCLLDGGPWNSVFDLSETLFTHSQQKLLTCILKVTGEFGVGVCKRLCLAPRSYSIKLANPGAKAKASA